MLLADERVPAQAVVDQARGGAQGAQILGIRVRARVARCDDEDRLERRVDCDHRGAAEVPGGAADQVPISAKRFGNAGPAVDEPTADNPFERMQAELQLRRDAEVAAATAQRPEQLGVLIGARTNRRPVRGDDLGADEVVAGETVLCGQMADPAPEGESGHAG